MAHEGYHELCEKPADETRDFHRAVTLLMEDLKAVDWYMQRTTVCKDAEPKVIPVNNRDDEMEHAATVLEWIRRRRPQFDRQLRGCLFTDKSYVELVKHGR